MKRGTPDHPKLLLFASKLEIPLYAAGGLLEFLWHWASRYAIQGDVGKWPNTAIAKGIGWSGDPDHLIDALVESGWLDHAPDPFRLVIHDAPDHADNTWKQSLTDCGLMWWNGTPARAGKPGRPAANLQKTSRKTPENLQENSSQTPQPEPEPEPCSTVIHISGTPLSQPSPLIGGGNGKTEGKDENNFTEFLTVCLEAKVSGGSKDWEKAQQVWAGLSLEDRLAAVRGIVLRKGIPDEPVLKSLPQNILAERKWERDVMRFASPSHRRSTSLVDQLGGKPL